MIMRKQITVVLSLLLACCMMTYAQDNEQQINSIKLCEDYAWEEATAKSESEAYEMAIGQLLILLNSSHDNTLTKRQLSPIVEKKTWRHGERCVAFVYIKKSEILQSTTTSSASIVTDTMTAPTSTVTSSVSMEVLAMLQEIDMAGEALKILNDYKAKGKVGNCGLVTSKNQLTPDVYLIIYDPVDTHVRAMLSNGTQRTNLSTGNDGNLSDYSGCGVIWFK